ncbi:RTA1-domain-containing protein [Plenodomus tracheiphilus IPT5]|uniref:RTA1-domain-containing protein n=1 Tax=Plenodomus tracheiphilus IPT5 TaxID=1408161 RepID=A0A6A7BJR0_9PLEO|nr:RTA1-domain-containing protein [Plenodomus tracheiphilus IPT5]
MAEDKFKLYHYDPSFPLAVAFIALFAIPSILHFWLLFRHRSWYFIPFLVGCLFEAVGYAFRALSAKETPDWTTTPYIGQQLLLLLGPTFFAASIYMVLGRLIRLLDAGEHSMIRTTWLTKVFLMGDILSFLSQSGGGGMLAKAKDKAAQDLGNNVILAGLGIQVVFFAIFMIVTVVFHIRITKRPTSTSLAIAAPWERLLWVLYFASVLIMVRSLFRMMEYAQGSDGFLMQKEMYVYAFDATLMFNVAAVFCLYHPGGTLIAYKKLDDGLEVNRAEDSYPMVPNSGWREYGP